MALTGSDFYSDGCQPLGTPFLPPFPFPFFLFPFSISISIYLSICHICCLSSIYQASTSHLFCHLSKLIFIINYLLGYSDESSSIWSCQLSVSWSERNAPPHTPAITSTNEKTSSLPWYYAVTWPLLLSSLIMLYHLASGQHIVQLSFSFTKSPCHCFFWVSLSLFVLQMLAFRFKLLLFYNVKKMLFDIYICLPANLDSILHNIMSILAWRRFAAYSSALV